MIRRIHSRGRFAAIALLGLLGGIGCIAAAEPAASKADFREVWVPSEDLPELLPTLGRSVAISGVEYHALRTEVWPAASKDAPAPPVSAALKSANFTGNLIPDASVATVRGNYVIESFSDGWSTVELTVDSRFAGAIVVDGQSAVRSSGKKGSSDLLLLVRGKGEHRVSIDLHLPVAGQVGGNWIEFRSPGAPGSLSLTIPQGLRLQSGMPFSSSKAGDAQGATFALPAKRGTHKISWSAEDIAPLAEAAVFQTCRFIYSIDPTRTRGDLGVVLSSSLAEIPDTASFDLPAAVKVLSIEGSEVLSWQRDGTKVELTFTPLPVRRRELDFRVIVEVPSLPDGGGEATLVLPTANIAGVHRASGLFAIVSSEDIRVKNITTGALVTQNYAEVDQDILNYPGFVGAFQFPALQDDTQISIQRLSNRFSTSIDTKVLLQREAIHIERAIAVLPTEGRIFETRIRIPEGEEMLSIRHANAPGGTLGNLAPVIPAQSNEANPVFTLGAHNLAAPLEWQKDSGENTYIVRWRDSQPKPFVVRTRRDPENWFTLGQEPTRLTFRPASVIGAEITSGYLVADFDDAFRVLSAEANGLEERAEFQPMPGKLTWFRLENYTLGLDVSKRSPEIEAEILGYLLPLANTLEIEGQINLDVKFSPIEKLAIKLPIDKAEFVRFDSPLISERKLDAASGTWTVTFHQGILGRQPLRFRMALPFTTSSSEGESRFAIDAPVFTLPDAKRLRGTWVGEANTDTEVTFTTTGLDEIDSLRVPRITGYQPRHRIIAAFNYRGDAHEMKIEGVRHQRAELVSTIIDDLRIDSLVARGGNDRAASDRHQVTMAVRTSGDQFLEVGLPKGAQLWTLTVDGAAAKPVVSKQGTLRIQLPAFAEGDRAMLIKLIYETAGAAWKSSARRELQPIRLAEDIPVLHSRWHLHLPDGFSYDDFDTNLTKRTEQERLPLVAHAAGALEDATTMVAYSRKSDRGGAKSVQAEIAEQIAEANELVGEFGAERGQAITPGHRKDVKEVDRLLRLATGYYDIGRYDNAEKQYNAVLRIDKYNETARRGMEELELARQQVFKTSRDHMRSKMLSQVDELWELAVPGPGQKGGGGDATALRSKLKSIIIPEIDFTEASVEEAVDFLRRQSQQHDPDKRGINIITHQSITTLDPNFKLTPINLQLTNVPLEDALKFTTDLAGLKYKLDPLAVIIVPAYFEGGQLVTQTFRVPPDFLTRGASPGEEPATDDPFGGGGGGGLAGKTTAKDLEGQGIAFPEGASATYIPATGELVVRSTQSNMDLIAAAVGPPKSDEIGDEVSVGYDSHYIFRGYGYGGSGKVGLLPLDFELPESGRTFVFEGYYAPDGIAFEYRIWERQIQVAWWWTIAGAIAFIVIARRRPIFLGLLGGIALTFLPVLTDTGLMPLCNALLAGWAAALVLTIVFCIAAKISRRIQTPKGGAPAHA